MNELRSPVERPCQPNGCRGTRVTELRIKAAVFFVVSNFVYQNWNAHKGSRHRFFQTLGEAGQNLRFFFELVKIWLKNKWQAKHGYSNFVQKALENDAGQGKSEICIDCLDYNSLKLLPFELHVFALGRQDNVYVPCSNTNSSTNSSAWWQCRAKQHVFGGSVVVLIPAHSVHRTPSIFWSCAHSSARGVRFSFGEHE